MDKIDELEMIEQEWKVAEESAKIQHMIDQDEAKQYGSKIILEALKPTADDGVPHKKWSLRGQSSIKASPTSPQSSGKIKFDGDSMYEKFKKAYLLKKST